MANKVASVLITGVLIFAVFLCLQPPEVANQEDAEMMDTNAATTEEGETNVPEAVYPPAPDGSRLPPREFRSKTRRIDRYMNNNGNECNDDECDAPSFGMFAGPLFTWIGLPSTLHFTDARPTAQAKTAMKILHDELLGYTVGKKQGTYGAGGGAVHVLYLGDPRQSEPAPSPSKRSTSNDFPNIDSLLKMLRPSELYQPSAMKWMTTMDPIHQHLFPKRREEEFEGEDSVLSLDVFCNLLVSQADLSTRRLVPEEIVPKHVTDNYPCLKNGRIIFLLPRFSSIHDGDCLAEPVYCPTARAFYHRHDRQESWGQFQGRPENNVGVYLEESSPGEAKEPGEIYESPVLALFQLSATGEIMALAQWDYRD